MIYTFNLMVELEPNGVDVAQAYRVGDEKVRRSGT